MAWLVQTNLATSWESDHCQRPPACLLHIGALDTSRSKPIHLGLEIVAHEVQVAAMRFRRMNCNLCWRQSEDQPPATGIDGVKAECLAEEHTIRIGVLAEEHNVRAKDHTSILQPERLSKRCAKREA